MEIDQLTIELTRRCNLKCAHCLRGAAQKVDIDPNIICKFLKKNQIDYITTLTFTGGEPCLNILAMKTIVNYIIKFDIQINMFYMATNGTIFNPDMLKPLSDIHSLIYYNDSDAFLIEISNDEYHTGKIDNRWNLLNIHYKYKNRDKINIISEGRGLELNKYGTKSIKDDVWTYRGDYLEGLIYINAKGHLLKHCDYSYKNQNIRHHGHCLSKPLLDFIGD
jgi:MoaA/NifB/PqqE/SkfB family radical SAM enzyme